MPGRFQVVVASVGDSRCVMYPHGRQDSSSRGEQLTNDHTADKPVEAMRVEMDGGTLRKHLAEV